MITRIQLGIDGSPGSRQAEALALELAAAHGAFLDAVAVIDTPWIDRPQAVGIGGASYRAAADQHILRDARALTDQLLSSLGKAAEAAGVAHALRTDEGDPADMLLAGSMVSDLIVIGRDARFWGGDSDSISRAALDVLRAGSRPVLLAPPEPVQGKSILMAFDASVPASRSLHMLALLRMAIGRPVHVVCVDESQERAEERVAEAAALLRAHGATDVTTWAIPSEADAAEILLQQAHERNAGIVAMGAFGHKGLREFLFGSSTQHLLHSCPVALFVHH